MTNPLGIERLGDAHLQPELVREAHTCILVGFLWFTTPQGHGYWNGVCDNLEKLHYIATGIKELSMCEEVEMEVLDQPNRYAVRKAEGAITSGFYWAATDQGSEYWREVTDALGALAEGQYSV